jgi:hypothetical protein
VGSASQEAGLLKLGDLGERDAVGSGTLGDAVPLCYLTRMPATKSWSSADFEAVIERVAPDILTLLSDGVPRSRATIVAALADRHPKGDVTLTLMRLDVLGRLVERGGKYTLLAAAVERG